MSHQSRSTEALEAAVEQTLAAKRAARNINRLRGHSGQPPSNPVNLDQFITGLIHIREIVTHLSAIIKLYADAVQRPYAGYSGSGGHPEGPADYPRSVADAAVNAVEALLALANKLGRGAPVGFSTDAIASLDVAVAEWRRRQRTPGK